MYLIDITIKTDKVPEEQADPLLADHRAWFGRQAEQGHFLIVGPYRDQPMAGLVLAQADTRANLDAIIAEDAYYPDMASYQVREFQANVIAEKITDYKGK